MTSKKKRKYGDLASQPANNDPEIFAEVFEAFTGRKPPTPAIQSPVDNLYETGTSTPAHSTIVRGTTLAPRTIVQPATVEHSAIAPSATVAQPTGQPRHDATVAPPAIVPPQVETKQYTSVPNDIFDKVLKALHVYDQAVLLRLYRLSRGYHKDTCTVGYPTLAKACNISTRQAQISVERLVAAGLIEITGSEQGGRERQARGNIYRMRLPAATPARGAIVQPATLARGATNKEYTLKETHKSTEGVGVRSRFALKECRTYADSLRLEGIQNPGGYATKIHRTGEADELIEQFLHPRASAPVVDASKCPDCQGTNFYYPTGSTGGVVRCKHERLLATHKS